MNTGRLLCVLAALLASACATHRGEDGRDEAELASFRIRSWSAPDDRTVLVEAAGGGQYRGQFASDCFGLRSALQIAFVTRGTNRLDRFAGVLLKDGTRCQFTSFERVSRPTRTAGQTLHESVGRR